jgi:hypothetical protein
MNSIAVNLAWLYIRQASMPDLICLLWQRDAMRLCLRIRRIEETQLNLRSVFGEERKVYSAVS